MHTEPEIVHQFIDRVTALLIRYVKYFWEETNNRVCGYIWPPTFFPCDVGVAFTEDLMPLLSATLYKTFALPYLQKFSETFGGLQIHCCGDWGRHAPTLKESGASITAVEFHYPFSTIEELACLADETVFIPYISLDKQDKFSSVTEYYESLLRHTDDRYRYWFAFAEDTEEAVNFARRYGF